MGLKELFQSSSVVLKKDHFQGKFVVLIIDYSRDLTKGYQCEVDCHNKLFISYKRLFFKINLVCICSSLVRLLQGT